MELQKYFDKWFNLDRLKTEKTDRKLVRKTIKLIHEMLEFDAPRIYFYDTPQGVFRSEAFQQRFYTSKRISKIPKYLGKIAKKLWFTLDPDFDKIVSEEFRRLETTMLITDTEVKFQIVLDFLTQPASISHVLGFDTLSYLELVRIDCAINECHLFWQEERKILKLLHTLLSNSFMIYSKGNDYFILERPSSIKLDEARRLHCLDGTAISFNEKSILYSFHGVTVDKQIILSPETQTIEQIKKEPNIEIKRIRIERYGWERYLHDTNAKVIDTRDNDVECTKESLMRGAGLSVLVCHCPSTGRIYTMEVPRRTKTCEQAQKYLWGGNKIKKLNILGRS